MLSGTGTVHTDSRKKALGEALRPDMASLAKRLIIY